MRPKIFLANLLSMIALSLIPLSLYAEEKKETPQKIQLPKAITKGKASLEEILWQRQSIRSFTPEVPKWEIVGQLLWAAQGINRPDQNRRTVPSAGATYPLELYVILPSGIYHYLPEEHAVVSILSGDQREKFTKESLAPGNVYGSPCIFVIAAVFERTAIKYKEEAVRYVHLEAGHAAQNLLLQATALGLGAVPIGSVVSSEEQKIMGLQPEEKPVYIVAAGYPK
ncbi:MAG: SagB/ThcOx family dehydrogenase [Candidatus Omnitrophota bacterium]